MDDVGLDERSKRSRSAQKAARTKAVKTFDKRIRELEVLVENVKSEVVDTTTANTMIRAYSCILEWTKAKREVHREEILAADIRSLREELSGKPDKPA